MCSHIFKNGLVFLGRMRICRKREKNVIEYFFVLFQALIVEEPSSEPRESSPANLVSLKTSTAALRDQIYRLEKEEEWKHGARKSSNGLSLAGSKSTEKQRKKLAELEAQLVLASPSLLFQVRVKWLNHCW